MSARRIFTVLPWLAALAALLAAVAVFAADVPRMSTDELKTRLGEADLVLLDARSVSDWQRATQRIAGAVRVDPGSVESWAGDYGKDQTIVLYCA